MRPAYIAAYNKFYFDHVYEVWITEKGFYTGIAGGTDWVDRNIVDRIGNIIGFMGRNLGKAIAMLENGQVQTYGAGMSVGVVFTMVVLLLWN